MRHPQILVYESDRRLAEFLQNRLAPLAASEQGKPDEWLLREPRRPETCLGLLRRGGPSVLVMKLGTQVAAELALLETVHHSLPDVQTVVVGDTEDPVLAGLAWDLGADFVLFPPHPRDLLPDVVSGLMQAAIHCQAVLFGPKATDESGLAFLPDTEK